MFSRLINIISGWFSLLFTGIESSNPEAVYEAAINATTKNYINARNAVAGIVSLRESTQRRVDKIQENLKQTTADLDASLNTDDDDLSAILLQKKKQLEDQLATGTAELTQISAQADKAKTDLQTVQGRIDELKRERETNLARYHTSQARKKLQDQLSGLSTDADIKALDNVRNAIDKSVATVQLNEEMAGTDIDQKLAKLRQTSGASTAKNEVLALKAARQQAAAGGAASGKSM